MTLSPFSAYIVLHIHNTYSNYLPYCFDIQLTTTLNNNTKVLGLHAIVLNTLQKLYNVNYWYGQRIHSINLRDSLHYNFYQYYE